MADPLWFRESRGGSATHMAANEALRLGSAQCRFRTEDAIVAAAAAVAAADAETLRLDHELSEARRRAKGQRQPKGKRQGQGQGRGDGSIGDGIGEDRRAAAKAAKAEAVALEAGAASALERRRTLLEQFGNRVDCTASRWLLERRFEVEVEVADGGSGSGSSTDTSKNGSGEAADSGVPLAVVAGPLEAFRGRTLKNGSHLPLVFFAATATVEGGDAEGSPAVVPGAAAGTVRHVLLCAGDDDWSRGACGALVDRVLALVALSGRAATVAARAPADLGLAASRLEVEVRLQPGGARVALLRDLGDFRARALRIRSGHRTMLQDRMSFAHSVEAEVALDLLEGVTEQDLLRGLRVRPERLSARPLTSAAPSSSSSSSSSSISSSQRKGEGEEASKVGNGGKEEDAFVAPHDEAHLVEALEWWLRDHSFVGGKERSSADDGMFAAVVALPPPAPAPVQFPAFTRWAALVAGRPVREHCAALHATRVTKG